MRPTKFTVGQVIVRVMLTLLLVITLLPFFMTLVISQKTNAEIHSSFWSPPRAIHPEYYIDAFKFIYRYIINSLIIGIAAVTGTVFLSSLSGYVFARIDFGGKRVLFMLLLSLMMVPGLLTLVPAFQWYKSLPFLGGNNWLGVGGTGLLNTRWVLIIPYITGGQIVGIFLCRTFFESIPNSLFEAARIDGAGEFGAYFHIGLPLSLPILATLAIMNFVGSYNDYIWPLVTITDSSLQTFSVGVTKFGIEGNLDFGPLMSGYIIGAIPLMIVFSVGMRYYVEGLTKGGLKA